MLETLGQISLLALLAAFLGIIVGIIIGIARKRWKVLQWSAAILGIAFALLMIAVAIDIRNDEPESTQGPAEISASEAPPPVKSKPSENSVSNSSPVNVVIEEPTPVPEITAGQLIEIKETNAIAFASEYEGRVYRISGLVHKVEQDGDLIDVKLQGRGNTLADLVCKISGDWEQAALIQNNTTVTVEGMVTDNGIIDLVVEDCFVVSEIVATANEYYVQESSAWGADAEQQVTEFNSLVEQVIKVGEACASDCKRCVEIDVMLEQLDGLVENALASGEWGHDFEIASTALSESFHKYQNNSIVLIKTLEGLGSGVVVNPSGLLLTNEHVVGKADFMDVQFPSGCVLIGEVVKADEDIDLAAVQLPDDRDYLHLSFANNPPKPSDAVSVWGYPLSTETGYDVKRTRGDVAHISANGLILDVVANPGSSGGPVLNEDDYVVGIVRAGSLLTSQILAVPLEVAREFVESVAVDDSDAPETPVSVDTPDVAERVLWVKVSTHENAFLGLRVQMDTEFDISDGWHKVYVSGVGINWYDAIYSDQGYLQIGTIDDSLSLDMRVSVSTDGFGDYRCAVESHSESEYVFKCIER